MEEYQLCDLFPSSLYIELVFDWRKYLPSRLSNLTAKLNFQQPMIFLRTSHWERNIQIIPFTNTNGRTEEKNLLNGENKKIRKEWMVHQQKPRT